MTQIGTDADGLVSAYQMTEITAGGPPVFETGGNLLIGVITIPYTQVIPVTPDIPESSKTSIERESQNQQSGLASEMLENPVFRELIERGLADLEQKRYKRITKEKIASVRV